MDKIRQAIDIHRSSVPSTSIRVDRSVDTVSAASEIYEADVYVAYRQYTKAKRVLLKALEQEPHRADLKLKLLNILFITRDIDGFMEQFQEAADLLKRCFPEGWQKAIQMGANMAPEKLVAILDTLESHSMTDDSKGRSETSTVESETNVVPPSVESPSSRVNTESSSQTLDYSTDDTLIASADQYVPKKLLDAWNLIDQPDAESKQHQSERSETVNANGLSEAATEDAEVSPIAPKNRGFSGRHGVANVIGVMAIAAIVSTVAVYHDQLGVADTLFASQPEHSSSTQTSQATVTSTDVTDSSQSFEANSEKSGSAGNNLSSSQSVNVVEEASLISNENTDMASETPLVADEGLAIDTAVIEDDYTQAHTPSNGGGDEVGSAVNITELLVEAESYRESRRLTLPEGENAYATYQLVLKHDPANSAAMRGIAGIGDDYEVLAKQALQKGDVSQSEALISRGLGVVPEHTGLIGLQKELERSLPVVDLTSQSVESDEGSDQLLDQIVKMQEQIDYLFERGAADASKVQQRDEYIEQLSSQVSQLLEQQKTREALRLVQSGLRVMPEHSELLAQQDKIKDIIEQRKEGSREATRFVDGLVAQAQQHREKGELEEAMQLVLVGLRLMHNHRPLLDLRDVLVRELQQASS